MSKAGKCRPFGFGKGKLAIPHHMGGLLDLGPNETALLQELGLTLPDESEESITIPADIPSLADTRWQARTAKNWAKSDRLLDELASLG